MNIHLIATHPGTKDYLKRYVESHGCDLLYDGPERIPNFKEVETLILLEPSKIAGRYLLTGILLKRYLRQNYPHIRLLIAGLNKKGHEYSNYIDLCHLDDDFHSTLSDAQPLSEDWGLPIGGSNSLRQKLVYFFKGHGQRSFMAEASNFRMTLRTAYYKYKEDLQNPWQFDQVSEHLDSLAKDQWDKLLRRYATYRPLLEKTPFWHEIACIKSPMEEISDFVQSEGWDQTVFSKTDFVEQFQKIYDRFESIDRKYIHSEQEHAEY